MPRSIHRTVIGRLVLVWLLLSAVGSGLVIYFQAEKIDRRVLKLALDESRTLTAACAEYARRPDARRLEELRRRSQEHVQAHFVVVELYDAGRESVLEVIRPGGDRISREAHARLHRFPLGGKPRYRKFFLDGRLFLQIMVPLFDDRGALIAYFEAVYLVDDETMRTIKEDAYGALALLLAAVLAASIALYPVIILLNRGLLRLTAELLDANLELMDTLGRAIAERDSETNAHNYRVTLYAVRLAEALGLDAERVRALIAGAFLHDVGKIGVRDDILLKPSALTEAELETMRGHVMKGVEIIARVKWLRGARAVVEFHHEKFDGSGYPKGLKGAQIPIVARIFAVADVFDALASRRPYKEPLGLKAALSVMEEKRGSHFDPEILDAFMIIVPALHRDVASASEDEAKAMLKRLVRRRFALDMTGHATLSAVISLFLLLSAASAGAENLVKPRPETAVLNERLELKPVAGHHFNLEAPQKCGKNRADEVTARVFRCQLASSGEVEVVVSVCDDAKTFCRQERFPVRVSGRKPDAARPKLEPKPHPFAAGFLVNEPGKAATLARRAHEPIFVHFYGIWCPPCNMLEEGVYPTEAFQKASEGFVKLALDADAELSWDWKARFKVGGYPTLLVLDERGQEVSRAVGYRSPEALAAFLHEAEGLLEEPIEIAALTVATSSPTEDGARRARVARWRLERAEFEEALAAAAAAPAARREALLARKELAAKNDDAPGVLSALKALAAEYKDEAEFADWVLDLALRDKPAAEALAPDVRASVARWAADPRLSERGLVPGDMRASEASFLEALGREADAKAAWSVAADAHGADAAASRLKLARGANLERAYCLQKAGRLDEARALYDSLVGAYPDEFTFHYGYARLLYEQKEHPAALVSARAAVRTGYGDNWLRAAALQARILKAMGLSQEAAKSLDAALADAAAPQSTAVRTHRYLAELRRLRSEL